MTRKRGPPLGVGTSFLIWGGSGQKILFDPISFFRIPIPPGYPPIVPPEYTIRRLSLGKVLYNMLGIEHDDFVARNTASARNYKFFGAPVGLIFTITWGTLLQISQACGCHNCRHFMQSITLGARAWGLELVTQLSVPKYDGIIRKHLPIRDYELVASMGYPDLKRIAEHYARPSKRPLDDVLESYGM
ncbi:hypothetical protein DFH09DRAFT_1088735 [Mycena vulgaris]|nr:hypothetical protein DFH09DRAFT_1088735 [Mycena vulgaris]